MSKFQPGQKKPSRSGRKKGTPNKKSTDLSSILDASGEGVPQRIINLLPELTPEKRADVLLSLMNFLYPKKKAMEWTDSKASEEPEKFEIVFVSPKEQPS